MDHHLKDGIEEAIQVQQNSVSRYKGVLRHSYALMGVTMGLIVLFFDEKVAADYFRWFTMAMGAYIVLFSARIIQVNYQISRRMRGGGIAALMPLHIQFIASSYIIFVVAKHAHVFTLVGESVVWYGLPATILADLIGIFGLTVIWRFQVAKREAMEHEVSS